MDGVAKNKNQKPTIPTKTHLPRRSFLHKVWMVLGILALIEFIGICIAFLRPRNNLTGEGGFGNNIEAGHIDNFLPDSVTAFVRGQFYLSRLEDGGFIALSRRCTHLGCTVPWNSEEKKFICPCHSSAFDARGDVISPPAPRALDIYPVTIENGIVKVDTNKKIQRNKFQTTQVSYPDIHKTITNS